MRYLNEREFGFDPDGLGFPSISGCHAMVLVTDTGLFGFHNVGGSANAAWADRAKAFRDFCRGHFYFGAPMRHLYGTSFVGNHGLSARGYSAPVNDSWIGELTAFATALDYGGPISGYDLGASIVHGSAYVEYRKVGAACEIWVKAWADGDATRGACDSNMNHKRLQATTVVAVVAQIVTRVDPAGLANVAATALRP